MPGKVKILFVSHSANLFGAERALLTLLKHLDKDKFVPLVVLPADGPLGNELEKSGVKTFVRPIIWWTASADPAGAGAALLERGRAISAIIEEEGADIVHTNTSVIAEGAVAAALSGKPHVWQLHEVLELMPSVRPVMPLPLLYRIVDTASDSLVAVSETLKGNIKKYIPSERINVIHNGIEPVINDPGRKTIREELGFGKDELIVCTVGQIVKEKCPEIFVDAAVRALKTTRARFLIVGGPADVELESRLKKKIEDERAGEYIKFLGHRNDARAILDDVDIYVVSSLTESFGLAALEAMSAGKPVVATRCGGPEEVVVDGETGKLVPVNDPGAMAEAILTLAGNPAKRAEMGLKGKKRFESFFSAENYARAFGELYRGLAGKKKSSDSKEALLYMELVSNFEERLIQQKNAYESLLKSREDSYQQSLESYKNSLSWKVTGPLRKASGVISNISGKSGKKS